MAADRLMTKHRASYKMSSPGCHQVDPLTGTEDPAAGQRSSDRFGASMSHVHVC